MAPKPSLGMVDFSDGYLGVLSPPRVFDYYFEARGEEWSRNIFMNEALGFELFVSQFPKICHYWCAFEYIAVEETSSCLFNAPNLDQVMAYIPPDHAVSLRRI